MGYFLDAFKRFADFKSRASRKEYWTFVFFNIFFIQLFWVGWIFFEHRGRDEFSAILAVIIAVLGFLYLLVVLIPTLALVVRRLHDTGRSGFYIFVSAIPLVGGVWLLVLLLLDSEKQQNKYGATVGEIDFTIPSSKSIIVLSIVWIVLLLIPNPLFRLSLFSKIAGSIVPIAVLIIGILFNKNKNTKTQGIILAAISVILLIVAIVKLQTMAYFVPRTATVLDFFASIALLWRAILWIQQKKVYSAAVSYAIIVAISLFNFTAWTLPSSIEYYTSSLYMLLFLCNPFLYYLLAGFLLPAKKK